MLLNTTMIKNLSVVIITLCNYKFSSNFFFPQTKSVHEEFYAVIPIIQRLRPSRLDILQAFTSSSHRLCTKDGHSHHTVIL